MCRSGLRPRLCGMMLNQPDQVPGSMQLCKAHLPVKASPHIPPDLALTIISMTRS
jgi:hypothetical protein